MGIDDMEVLLDGFLPFLLEFHQSIDGSQILGIEKGATVILKDQHSLVIEQSRLTFFVNVDVKDGFSSDWTSLCYYIFGESLFVELLDILHCDKFIILFIGDYWAEYVQMAI